MKQRIDERYVRDLLSDFYRARKFGNFAEAVEAFVLQHPDLEATLVAARRDALRKEWAIGLKREYDVMDRDELPPDVVQPSPHLRDRFLHFAEVEIPPMSPSISWPDGKGRIAPEDATAQQHRDHHATVFDYHDRGAKYRRASRDRWDTTIDALRDRLPDVADVEHRPLTELANDLERYHQANDERAADDPGLFDAPI